LSNQRKNIQKILIFIYPIHNYNRRDISTIYIHNKTSTKRNILAIKQNANSHIIFLPILVYTIPRVTNKKEINIHDIIIENETTTTTTVKYNQIIGTVTTILILYILLTHIAVVNIINVSKGPLRL